MLYVIGLAIASIVGMFGFVFTSGQKESHDQKKKSVENLYNQRPAQPTRPIPVNPPVQPKKLPLPLAIFGIFGSAIVSIFSLLFFFGRNKQQKRNQAPLRRVLPNYNSRIQRPNPHYYQQQVRQFPQQIQRRLPPQIQPKKKKKWWWPF